MIRPMIRRAVAAAFVLCSCGYAVADTAPAGPSLYDSWAKCKPGAMTKVESSTEAMGQTTKMVITTKLIEVTPEKVVVEIQPTMEMMGQKMAQPATKQEIKAKQETPKMPEGMDASKAPKAVMGKETVTVGGKSLDCTTAEIDTESSGTKIKSKTWSSADVPGTIVKMTATTEGQMASKTTMTLVEFTDGK